MKEKLYIQTRLERVFPDRREEMVSWIPAEIAQKGNIVRLKDNIDKEWSEGWKVLSDFGNPIAYSKLVRKTRFASLER